MAKKSYKWDHDKCKEKKRFLCEYRSKPYVPTAGKCQFKRKPCVLANMVITNKTRTQRNVFYSIVRSSAYYSGYYYHLFILKIIRTVVQLFTSVDKSNYKVHRSFNKSKFSSSLRLVSEISLMQSTISVIM